MHSIKNTHREVKSFTIRVYALIIKDRKEILLSDEYRMGMPMTKFPGGGMRPGESTLECLHREAIEEFGQDIDIIRHYYTTDFFQQAAFFPDKQLVSIYYLAQFTEAITFPISNKIMDITYTEGSQSFRWQSIDSLHADTLTFPIDKKVATMIRADFDTQQHFSYSIDSTI